MFRPSGAVDIMGFLILGFRSHPTYSLRSSAGTLVALPQAMVFHLSEVLKVIRNPIYPFNHLTNPFFFLICVLLCHPSVIRDIFYPKSKNQTSSSVSANATNFVCADLAWGS